MWRKTGVSDMNDKFVIVPVDITNYSALAEKIKERWTPEKRKNFIRATRETDCDSEDPMESSVAKLREAMTK